MLDTEETQSKSIAHCQALIKPLRRLRSLSARIVSLTENENIDLLSSAAEDETSIKKFCRDCCAEMMNLEARISPVLKKFDLLTRLIRPMSQHPFWRDMDIEKMDSLLHRGRSAREEDNIEVMDSVLQAVLDMLTHFNYSNEEFIKQMKQISDMKSENDIS